MIVSANYQRLKEKCHRDPANMSHGRTKQKTYKIDDNNNYHLDSRRSLMCQVLFSVHYVDYCI